MYRVKNPTPEKMYPCKDCKVALAMVIEAGETLAMTPGIPDRKAMASNETILEPPRILQPDEALALTPSDGSSMRVPEDLKDLLPKSFNGYTVIKLIARGGMGAVILAQKTELRRNVAIKVMLPWAVAGEPEAQVRFAREARAMAKLRHPHIIEIYDVGTVGGMAYLVMEFVDGRTLSDVILANATPYHDMAEIIAKVARALACAHARGVIHRDIKPANIMVRPTGEPVVMDFGLAKDFDASSVKLSVTGNIMGTPSYMSPEQAQGLHCDERSDLYSLGAVLYEALTRQAPFDGETGVATIYNVVHKEAQPAHVICPNVPEALSQICAKALEKNPLDRYVNMDALASDLDRFRAGMKIGASGKSRVRKGAEWTKKNRGYSGAAMAAGATLLLMAVALQLGWLRTGKTKSDELRAALTSGSAETRLLHLKALAGDLRERRIAAGSLQEQDAFSALRLAAADRDAGGEVAAAALQTLGEFRDKNSTDTILEQLDAARPLPIRRAAIQALGRLNPQGLITYLSAIIKAPNPPELRVAAIEALPEIAPPDVMILLIEVSVKGEPSVLAAAANQKLNTLRPSQSVLSFYTGGATVRAAQEVGRVVNAAKDYNEQLEAAMGEINDRKQPTKTKPQPFEKAMQRLLSAERGERLQAAYDLGILADRRSDVALLRTFEDSDGDVALAAAEALSKIPGLESPQRLVPLLKNASPGTRRAAARATGLLRLKAAESALNEALQLEKFSPVQGELAVALGRLKAKGAVTSLVAVLSTGSTDAARKAAWALGQIGDASANAALVDALKRAGSEAELKEDIAAALSALTK